MSQLEIAANAVDCYADEIKGWCKCKVFIYEPTKEEKVWQDSELSGLCTIHLHLLSNTISLNVVNLITKQVSFKAKEIKNVDFQDETFISFTLKCFEYSVGLRLMENAEQFTQDFHSILRERAEHSNMSLEKPNILPQKPKKRFSIFGSFKFPTPNETKPKQQPRLRISLPHTDQFKHINHVEWDSESNQLIYKDLVRP